MIIFVGKSSRLWKTGRWANCQSHSPILYFGTNKPKKPTPLSEFGISKTERQCSLYKLFSWQYLYLLFPSLYTFNRYTRGIQNNCKKPPEVINNKRITVYWFQIWHEVFYFKKVILCSRYLSGFWPYSPLSLVLHWQIWEHAL